VWRELGNLNEYGARVVLIAEWHATRQAHDELSVPLAMAASAMNSSVRLPQHTGSGFEPARKLRRAAAETALIVCLK